MNFFQNKRRLMIIVISVLILLLAGGFLLWAKLTGRLGSRADVTKNQAQVEFVSNQILIKLTDEGAQKVQAHQPKTRSEEKPSFDAKDTGVNQLNKTNELFKATKVEKALRNKIGSRGPENTDPNLDRWYVVNLDVPQKNIKGDPSKITVETGSNKKFTYQQMLNFYRRTNGVEKVEANLIFHTSMIPNDTYYSTSSYFGTHGDLWNLKKIGAEQAWDKTTGNGVVVAVVDTGVDYNHPDLKNNILKDATGKVVGYDFANNDADPMDDGSHGTHVAGIIAAQGNNDPNHTVDTGTRIIGVGPNLKIMPVKSIGADGWGYISDLMGGIKWAADHGAKVINNSWGGYGDESQFSADTISYAHNKNIVVVFSSGNSSDDTANSQPAGDPNAITVGASNYQDGRAAFSNFGTGIDLLAPGGDSMLYGGPFDDAILSARQSGSQYPAALGQNYTAMAGTSMAAPQVAGAAGLILALHPDWTAEEVRFALKKTADVLNGGWTQKTASGRLNIAKALALNSAQPVALFDLPDGQWFAKQINGTISARLGVSKWSLSLAKADVPDQPIATWENLISGTSAITGKLADIDSSKYSGLYILKLEVTDKNNQVSQDFQTMTLDADLLPGWPRNIGAFVTHPAIADINQDGQNEIILLTDGGLVNVLRGNGDEISNFPVDVNDYSSEGFGVALSSPTLADLNKDNKPEIVFMAEYDYIKNGALVTTDKLYAIKSDGTFLAGWPQELTGYGGCSPDPNRQGICIPSAVDLDNDGNLEIAVKAKNFTYIFRSNGQPLTGWPQITDNTDDSLSFGDINSDQKMEIFTHSGKTSINVIGYNLSGTVLSGWPKQTYNLSQDLGAISTEIIDINNDGKKEIMAFARNYYPYPEHLAVNVFKGDGTLLWSKNDSKDLSYPRIRPIFTDLMNNISGVETIVPNYKNTKVYNSSNGDILASWPVSCFETNIFDVNNDNIPELACVGDASIKVFDNQGKTLWQRNYIPGSIATLTSPIIGDVDGDGKIEIIANLILVPSGYGGNYQSQTYVWKLNQSSVPKNTLSWPQYRYDAQHSGIYQKNTPPPTTNLIQNGNFEQGDTLWYKRLAYPTGVTGTGQIVIAKDTNCLNGSQCAKMVKGNATASYISQKIGALEPNKTYRLFVRFKTDTASSANINFYDATDKKYYSKTIQGTGALQQTYIDVAATTTTAPHDWYVYLYGTNASTIYYDEVVLQKMN